MVGKAKWGRWGRGGGTGPGKAAPGLFTDVLVPHRQVLRAARCVVCARRHPICSVVMSSCCVARRTNEDVTALPVTFPQVSAYLEQLLLDHCHHLQSDNMLAESMTLNHLGGQLRFSSSDVEGRLSTHEIEQFVTPTVTVTACPSTSWISRSKRPGNCYPARPPPREQRISSTISKAFARRIHATCIAANGSCHCRWPIPSPSLAYQTVACRSVHAHSW